MLSAKLDEDAEDRHKEISLLKNHIQKEREEIRGQVSWQDFPEIRILFKK